MDSTTMLLGIFLHQAAYRGELLKEIIQILPQPKYRLRAPNVDDASKVFDSQLELWLF